VRIKNIFDESTSTTRVKKLRRTYEVCSEPTESFAPNFERLAEQDFFRRNRLYGFERNPERLLPNYVFGYYSGTISRFESIFERHENQYYNEQITGEETPLRPLFLAKPHHSQFAFLSFFAVDDAEARQFLSREMRITGLDSVLFALREPYWAKSKQVSEKAGGDGRFWGAAGKVAPFLNSLFHNSFVPMSFSERVRVSIGQRSTKERRYCFVRNRQGLERLAVGLSNKEFFARLESLVFSNLVSDDGSDVRIFLNLEGVEEPVSFNDLAEGERQLLTVLGLLRFTAEDEALFIMDEPDTHLNPAWCLDYLDNLKRYGADLKTSQIIMTTHSPLTFAGLNKSEVVVLRREGERIIAEHPTSSPKGMGFAAILTSEFFGLRSTLDRETLEDVERLRFLAAQSQRSREQDEELARLNKKLSALGFSREFRDPLFSEFVREMAKSRQTQPDLWSPVLSPQQKRRREKIVSTIADKLRKRQADE
jgi:ABC-type multidrug transport system ATPase subunit